MKFLRNISRSSIFTSCVLIAMVISLVVNFNYLILLILDKAEYSNYWVRHSDNAQTIEDEGRLSVNVDGYGYIVTEKGDSIYIDRGTLRRTMVKDGDLIHFKAIEQTRYKNSHPIVSQIIELNSEPFDYSQVYNTTQRQREALLQVAFYFFVSLLLLVIMNLPISDSNKLWSIYIRRATICIVISIALYYLAPVYSHYKEEVIMLWQGSRLLDFVVIFKVVFMLTVILLYSYIYMLIHQRQQIVLENEQLKNENLTTRYNMLVSQVNPHFFFNSLNSLSMLIREQETARALEYINQLSYTFRYITQNSNNSELVKLSNEMEFAEAYCYLFRIRYADKIFFDINIEEKYKDWLLPALSLQPLIGNTVKHNSISSKKPFHVNIYTENGYLIVANKRQPLLEPQISTGTGLSNLNSRFQLILDRNIEIIENSEEFIVKLPLVQSNNTANNNE